ncbi:unnamed protein product [Brassica rapa subsp. narinosa]|uniref:(rape) hypothetical protein n=1 Tax=Brassica napus TaxID=3708 RepID=A0A816X6I4_BRANA|nr:unnamed protein product [Brassica napus]
MNSRSDSRSLTPGHLSHAWRKQDKMRPEPHHYGR